VSNSPCSAERLAGTSKQVFELSSDLYGLIQKLNLLNSNGKNIITGISKLKAEKWYISPGVHSYTIIICLCPEKISFFFYIGTRMLLIKKA